MTSESETEPPFSRDTFHDLMDICNAEEVWRTFSDGLVEDDALLHSYANQPLQQYDAPALLRRASTDLTPMPPEEAVPESVPEAVPLQPEVSQLPAAAVALPVLQSWPGRHQFAVTVRSPPAAGRQLPYVFSNGPCKLYTDIMVAVPFSFRASTSGADKDKLRIRALPVYRDAHHQHEPVRRCPTHREATHISNEGETELLHVIRAEHPAARYKSVEERRSVVVPYKRPEPGMHDYTVPFKFTCMNTCVGGINRRRLAVVFTLENRSTGEVVGRQSVEVKVCRCPHRDWRTDQKRRADGPEHTNKRRRQSPADSGLHAGSSGKWIVEADDKEMYEYLLDQKQVLVRMRERRSEAENEAPVALSRQPTTPIKNELLVFQ